MLYLLYMDKLKNTLPVVCGIIAEYDPFHLGHAKQFAQIKERLNPDYIVCVISCAFGQRGDVHLFSSHARAQMAVEAGCDLVLGLPYSFGTAPAERFALGGVDALNRLGVVTHLCFGVEESSLPLLPKLTNTSFNQAAFKAAMDEGLSYAEAQSLALAQSVDINTPHLNLPNLNLALAYYKAAKELDAKLVLEAFPRRGNYHSTTEQVFPSASFVRHALVHGNWSAVKKSVPHSSYEIIKEQWQRGYYCLDSSLDTTLFHRLLTMDLTQLRNLAEVSEGIEHRLHKCMMDATSRKDLVLKIKTKRYPYTRLNRIISHALVGLNQQDCPKQIPYVRLLGMSKRAPKLLRLIKKTSSNLPIIVKVSKCTHPLFTLEKQAEGLWLLGAKQPLKHIYTQEIIKEKEGAT